MYSFIHTRQQVYNCLTKYPSAVSLLSMDGPINGAGQAFQVFTRKNDVLKSSQVLLELSKFSSTCKYTLLNMSSLRNMSIPNINSFC